MSTGFELVPDFSAGWSLHNPDDAASFVQASDGVRVTGAPYLPPATGVVGMFSFLTWEGDFSLSFSTRLIDVEPGRPVWLDVLFGVKGSGAMPPAVGAWELNEPLERDYYARWTTGARLQLYAEDLEARDRNQTDAILDIMDGTGTPKRLRPRVNQSFGRVPETTYHWRLIRYGREVRLEQTSPDGTVTTCTWIEDLIPQFASEGSFGFLIPPTVAFDFAGLSVDEPDSVDARTPASLGRWRLLTDPSTRWTVKIPSGSQSEAVEQFDAYLFRARKGAQDSILVWGKTQPEDNWRFSWRQTWFGTVADNNGSTGWIDFIFAYRPTDGSDPNTWAASAYGDASPETLATRGTGLALRLAVQDADVPDQTDRTSLMLLQGDGTLEGVSAVGSTDLGFLPGVAYDLTVEKIGSVVSVTRSSLGSADRTVVFSSPQIPQFGQGYIGLRIAPDREVLVERFDQRPFPSRLRGGKLPVRKLRPIGSEGQEEIVDIFGLQALLQMSADREYIVTVPLLDLQDQTILISGSGDRHAPLTLRGGSFENDPSTFPVITNGILEIAAQGLGITGLTFDDIQLRLLQGTRTVHIQGNWFRGLRGGLTRAAISAAMGEDVADIVIAHNLVAPEDPLEVNRGCFLDIEDGSDDGTGGRRFLVERNDLAAFGPDPSIEGEWAQPIPIILGRTGVDFNRNADVMIRHNRAIGMITSVAGWPWVSIMVGGVRVIENTFEIDDTHAVTILAPQGRITQDGTLPFDAGYGHLVRGNLLVSSVANPAQSGIRIGDGYGRVLNNWCVQLDAGEQPSLDNPLAPASIIVQAADHDWRVALWETDRNAGRASVGGNRMLVIDGFGGAIPPDGCVIAPADPDRSDRNFALTTISSAADFTGDLPGGRIEATDRSTQVPDGDYARVPVRLLAEDVGVRSLVHTGNDPLPYPSAPSDVPPAPAEILFPTPLTIRQEVPPSNPAAFPSVLSLDRNIYVMNDAAYGAALDDLRAGDEIVVADGVEVGWRELHAGGTFDRPVTIRAETPGGAAMDGIRAAGANIVFHGFDFHARKIELLGQRLALYRCLFHDWRGGPTNPQVEIRGTYAAIGFCDIRHQHGLTIAFDGRHGARQGHVFGCLFGDCDVDEHGNAGPCIQVIPAQVRGTSLHNLIETSLFYNINQSVKDVPGTIIVDGSDNLVRFVQLNDARSLQVIGGRRNTIAGVRLTPGNAKAGHIDLRGLQNRCYGSVVENPGRVRLLAGDTTQEAYEKRVGSFPAAVGTWIADSSAAVAIGVAEPSAPSRVVSDTTLVGMRAGWSYTQTRSVLRTNLFPDDPAPRRLREVTTSLTPAMVGLRGKWPYPSEPGSSPSQDGVFFLVDDNGDPWAVTPEGGLLLLDPLGSS